MFILVTFHIFYSFNLRYSSSIGKLRKIIAGKKYIKEEDKKKNIT